MCKSNRLFILVFMFLSSLGLHAEIPAIPVRGLEEIKNIDAWTTALFSTDQVKSLPVTYPLELWLLVSNENLSTSELYTQLLAKYAGPYSAADSETLARTLYEARENLRYVLKNPSSATAKKKLALLSHLAEETLLATSSDTDKIFRLNKAAPQGCDRSGELSKIKVCAGDVLLSKGAAGSSSFLSRISDFPGNFSHTTLVYLNENNKVLLPEAEIEDGTKLRDPQKDYETNPKTRLYAYRLKTNEFTAQLPAQAAERFRNAMIAKLEQQGFSANELQTHTSYPYDSYLNSKDPRKLFCSEVVELGYVLAGASLQSFNNPYPELLWSSIKDPEVVAFFRNFLGIHSMNFPAPSDIELNPRYQLLEIQINRANLKQDRVDVALIEVLVAVLKADKELTQRYTQFFANRAEVAIHESDLQKLVAAGVLQQADMDKILKNIPPEIGLKQIIFFGYLNNVLNPQIRDLIKTQYPQSEKLGPMELRKIIATQIKDKLQKFAALLQ